MAPFVRIGPPPVKEIKNPGGTTGGTRAPSGASVAARMAQERKTRGQAYTRRTRAEAAQRRSSAGRGSGGATSSTPYSAFDSPYKTQAQFNQGVAKNAETLYKPDLNAIGTEEQGETGLHGAREGENTRIYNQYAQQAQDAFNQAKAAQAEIAARANSSTDAGQKALQAALSNTGVSGLSGVPNADAFMQEAAGLGNAGSQALAGEQAGTLGELSKNEAVPGAWRNEAQATENQRYTGALGKLNVERKKVQSEIPADIAKTRTEMGQQEVSREGAKLQNEVAQRKLGLEKEAKVELGKERLGQRKEEGANKLQLAKEKLEQEGKIKQEAVGVARTSAENTRIALQAKIAEAKDAKHKAAAALEAKRYDAGLQIMANYLKVDENREYQPTGNPATDEATAKTGKHGPLIPYRRDAMHLYTMLTKQGNLTAPEAFRVMKTSGNGYVEKFAEEHEADFNARTHARDVAGKIKSKPFQPLHQGK